MRIRNTITARLSPCLPIRLEPLVPSPPIRWDSLNHQNTVLSRILRSRCRGGIDSGRRLEYFDGETVWVSQISRECTTIHPGGDQGRRIRHESNTFRGKLAIHRGRV